MGIADYVRAALDACAVGLLILYALRRRAARTGRPAFLVPSAPLSSARYFARLAAGYLAVGASLYLSRYLVSAFWRSGRTVGYDTVRFGMQHAALSAWVWTLLFAGIALAVAYRAPPDEDDSEQEDDEEK